MRKINIESLKTMLLIFLVGLSLFLIYRLWYVSPAYEIAQIAFQETAGPNMLKDEQLTIFPQDMVIFLPNEEHLVYNRGSKEMEAAWPQITEAISQPVTQAELPAVETETYMAKIRFNPPYPARVLWGDSVRLRQIWSIYILPGGEFLLVEGANVPFTSGKQAEQELKRLVLRIEDENNWRLLRETFEAMPEQGNSRQLEDINGIFANNEEIMVPAGKIQMYAQINLLRDQKIADEVLRKVFFDVRLARRIDDQDGSVIFTDGDRGLRIGAYLDYSAPGFEKGTESLTYQETIQQAHEHAYFYGGWPDGFYLTRLDKAAEGYHAVWRLYLDGYPVLGGNTGIEMHFNDHGLYRYRRTIYPTPAKPEEKITVADATAAAIKIAQVYREEFGADLPGLDDLFLAYYAPSQASVRQQSISAFPVWAAFVNGKTLLLHAGDLGKVQSETKNGYF